MVDAETRANTEDERSIIHEGRNFEDEFRLDSTQAGEFLIDLGEQLRDTDELTLRTSDWELPFSFGEPVEIGVDFEGVDGAELEFEVELRGKTDQKPPAVD